MNQRLHAALRVEQVDTWCSENHVSVGFFNHLQHHVLLCIHFNNAHGALILITDINRRLLSRCKQRLLNK